MEKIRYLKQANLQNEQLLQKDYFRELISQYGVDVQYFRYNPDWFHPTNNINADWILGASSTAGYPVYADMVIFMNVDAENTLLSNLGIETTITSEIYIVKQEFTETWRDIIGTPITADVDLSYEYAGGFGDITGNLEIPLSGEYKDNDLTAQTNESVIIPNIVGTYDGIYSTELVRSPKKTNSALYISEEYTERYISSDLSGAYEIDVDVSGDYTVSGSVTGEIAYYSSYSTIGEGPNWGISPQVGDMVRLSEVFQTREDFEHTPNLLEFEISDVRDQDIAPAGSINQLLQKYCWRCVVVRRDPSHEDVVGDLQEENMTADQTIHNDKQELISDAIFDYDSQAIDEYDGENSDSVFGNY